MGGGTASGYHIFLFSFSVFVLLLIVLSWLVLCCVFLIVSFLLSLSLVPLIRCYYSAWKLLCLFCKTISVIRFLITTLWISLKKGECFDFNHTLGILPYFIQSELDFYFKFIISASWFITPIHSCKKVYCTKNLSVSLIVDGVSFLKVFSFIATFNHSGTLDTRHYTAFIKQPNSSYWLFCNNAAVFRASLEKRNDTSYLFLYKAN